MLRWERNLTVRQAISIAGGGTPRAALNRIRIVRNKGGTEEEFKPELGEFVMPNDVIKVPESWF
jgi:polysaccharide export outer membrane protein